MAKYNVMDFNFSQFAKLAHNGNLINKAEDIMNDYLNVGTSENHKTGLWLENPDGTRVAIQPGFKLYSYEYVVQINKD